MSLDASEGMNVSHSCDGLSPGVSLPTSRDAEIDSRIPATRE